MTDLCLVDLDAAPWSACPASACADDARQLPDSGRMLAAEPLHATHTTTTVRLRNGQRTLFDGPFAGTREMLAGFDQVDANDLNEAIQIADGVPPARHGTAAPGCGRCANGGWRPAGPQPPPRLAPAAAGRSPALPPWSLAHSPPAGFRLS